MGNLSYCEVKNQQAVQRSYCQLAFSRKTMYINDMAKLVEDIAFFKLTYGLFVLSSGINSSSASTGKNGGCITNTVMQITDIPKQIVIAVNKLNFTHDLIAESKKFNLSVLTTDSKFDIFQRFGFQSGRDVDKFAGFENFCKKSENGLYYVTLNTNAFLSGDVISISDYGTHSLVAAQVSEAAVLSNAPSLSYQYYFDNIKPKPAPKPQATGKKTYVCRICGHVEEAEGELPDDYICPLCKHPKADMVLQG